MTSTTTMRSFSAYLFLLLLSLSVSLAIIQDALVGHWSYRKVIPLFRFASQKLAVPYKSIAAFVPPYFDFWRFAKDQGDKAKAYTKEILDDEAAQYASRSDQINDLKKEFSEPLPKDQTDRYQQRSTMVARALDTTEDALVNVCQVSRITGSAVRTKLCDIKPRLNHSLLIIANFVNNHPVLFETLLFSGAIPQSPILWLILAFGPLGPIKGSFAAFAQCFFFGAAIEQGSWSAMLKRAGMIMTEVGVVMKIFQVMKCFFWGTC